MKAKEIRRKLCAIALVACMVSMTTAPAQAAGKSPSAQPTQPTGFTAPEILTDANGRTYDLGGMEIIVRDWWTSDYDIPDEDKTEYELARDEYWDWIQETYNFTIKRQAISDWSSAPQDFVDYASAPADNNNYVFVLRDDPLTTEAMRSGLCTDLSKLSCLDFSSQKFQANLSHVPYTFGDAIYAMYGGYSEPRTGVYFNKRLLQEAGVDPESIYDMQKNGTWTWDAFEDLCKKVTRDTDNDGKIDVYACNCNNGVMIEQAVYSNGGNFISKDANGKFVNSLKEDASIEGLRFAQHLMDEYWEVEPEGAAWDFYKQAFRNGEYVFCIDQAYVMDNEWQPRYLENGEIDPEYPGMSDPVGFVMFPKGPRATDYVDCWSNNFMCIPSNYDAERAWNIAFAWNLYTDEIPGYEDNWKQEYKWFDERALNETLEMMRAKGTVDCIAAIPEIKKGEDLTWQIEPQGNNLEAVINYAVRKWDYYVKKANGEQFPEPLRDEQGNIYDLGGMEITVADWFSIAGFYGDEVQMEARNEYLQWIQDTYNFKIVEQQEIYDWSTSTQAVLDYINDGGDNTNYIFMLRRDPAVLEAMKEGMFYDLSTLDCLDFSEEKFQLNRAHEKYSLGDAIYGMSAESNGLESGLYFNKQVLRDAGIDPDSIYEMQANGTWTWDKFEELCKKLTRDVDGDGTIDVYGCEGNTYSLAQMAVFSNGGAFIGKDENGKFTYNLEDAETVAGLEFSKKIMDNYWGQDPEGAAWNYYLSAFGYNKIAFCPEYVNYASEVSGYFEWYDKPGFVAFPKGPNATDYVSCWDGNYVVIPGCYDENRAWNIAFAWNLFTNETYAYDESDSWKVGYEADFDEKAIDETLDMMRKKAIVFNHNLTNFDIGNDLLWQIWSHGPSISEVIDLKHVKIENAVREANGEALLVEDENYGITNKSLTLYDTIAIEFKLPVVLSNEEYHDQYLLVKMNGKDSIIQPKKRNDMLVYTLNVAPQMLGDEIIVEPHAINAQGQDVTGQRMRYSAKTYCMNVLTKPSFEGAEYADLRKLCVDMLAYGDAAQVYDGYKMDALASADLTDAQRQQGTNPTVAMTFDTVKDKTFDTVSESVQQAEISAVALYLEGKVNIQFKFTAENLNGLRLVVTDGTNVLGEYVPNPNQKDKNGRYYVNFDELNAGQMKETVYASMMKGEETVSNTYRYSIESYVNSMLGKGGANLDNLLLSMMRYGNSAAEYAQNHQQ